MKIGIDIDDVVTNTSQVVIEYLDKYETSGDGNKYIVEIMRGEVPTQNIKNFLINYGAEIFKHTTLKDNAKEIIENLYKQGHEIILITSRGDITFPGSEKATLEFLKNNNIKYSSIIFNSFEKQIDCKNNNVDIMIDDSVKNCESVKNAGITTILYNSDVNKNINTNIERVDNWIELNEKINKFKRV